MHLSPQKIEAFLNENIPITGAMGMKVRRIDEQSVLLAAPLVENIDHRGTAFGGSTTSLAIMAGWTLLHYRLALAEMTCRLVIQKSETEYLSPVETDFEAECTLSQRDWEDFCRALSDRGKARITLTSTIRTENGQHGSHKGIYVAIATD